MNYYSSRDEFSVLGLRRNGFENTPLTVDSRLATGQFVTNRITVVCSLHHASYGRPTAIKIKLGVECKTTNLSKQFLIAADAS